MLALELELGCREWSHAGVVWQAVLLQKQTYVSQEAEPARHI